MSAFNALEKRILDLSLARASDNPEAAIVVGLFKSEPLETHNGAYGQQGEPAAQAPTAQGGYRRARATFATQAAGSNNGTTTNTSVITITGLTPGVYTHFGVFGSTGGVT